MPTSINAPGFSAGTTSFCRSSSFEPVNQETSARQTGRFTAGLPQHKALHVHYGTLSIGSWYKDSGGVSRFLRRVRFGLAPRRNMTESSSRGGRFGTLMANPLSTIPKAMFDRWIVPLEGCFGAT